MDEVVQATKFSKDRVKDIYCLISLCAYPNGCGWAIFRMPIMYLTATIYKQLFKAKVEIHVAKKPVPIYESEERGSSDISETFMKVAPNLRGHV